MWEGKDGPQPDLLSDLSQTWKEQHPDWTYIFWNGEKIDAFMAGHAEYRDVYNSYPYAVQRWDMIRYLILYEYGGIYADLDYECIDALDSLLENEFCCLKTTASFFSVHCWIVCWKMNFVVWPPIRKNMPVFLIKPIL